MPELGGTLTGGTHTTRIWWVLPGLVAFFVYFPLNSSINLKAKKWSIN